MTNAEKRIIQEYKKECQDGALYADANCRRIRWSAKLAAVRELHKRLYNEQRPREAERKPPDPNVFPDEPAHPNEPCTGVLTRENDPTAS